MTYFQVTYAVDLLNSHSKVMDENKPFNPHPLQANKIILMEITTPTPLPKKISRSMHGDNV